MFTRRNEQIALTVLLVVLYLLKLAGSSHAKWLEPIFNFLWIWM